MILQLSLMVSIGIILLGLSTGCTNEVVPKEFPSAAESAKHLIDVGHVGTDVEFTKQLTDDGQREDHSAPLALRKLLAGEEIGRWIFSQGISYEKGNIALYWSINDCGLAGGATNIQQKLLKKLDEMGFKSFPSPEERYQLAYHRDLAGAEETVLLNKPKPWIGGQRPFAGIELLWSVRSTSTAPMLKYAEMKRIMPIFYDKRIKEPIYKLFQDDPLVDIRSGGTWTKYYSSSFAIAALPNDEKSVDALHQKLVARIEKAGYKQEENRPQFSTWDGFYPNDSQHGRPIINVKVDKDKSCVHISIQAE